MCGGNKKDGRKGAADEEKGEQVAKSRKRKKEKKGRERSEVR